MESVIAAIANLILVANSATPFAIIALLIGVFYVLLWKLPLKAEQKLDIITSNHLHELPTIAANTQRMVESLQRLEISQARIETKIDSWTE